MSNTTHFITTAYHGTDQKSAGKIAQEGFTFAEDNEAWLGQGAYFFLDGIRSGLDMASDWSSFRTEVREPVVVSCRIVAPWDTILDLRCLENMRLFDDLRHKYANENFEELLQRRDLSKKKRRDVRLDDAIISRQILKQLGKKIMLHNLYIKTKVLRELQLESTYPTCTACCVNDPSFITNIVIINPKRSGDVTCT